MSALYLYFAGHANPGRAPSASAGERRPFGVPSTIDEGPLVPIQPGAFSRWKANRDRVVSENAAALRSALDGRASGGAQSPKATG